MYGLVEQFLKFWPQNSNNSNRCIKLKHTKNNTTTTNTNKNLYKRVFKFTNCTHLFIRGLKFWKLEKHIEADRWEVACSRSHCSGIQAACPQTCAVLPVSPCVPICWPAQQMPPSLGYHLWLVPFILQTFLLQQIFS